jgi:hypothetical protein
MKNAIKSKILKQKTEINGKMELTKPSPAREAHAHEQMV